MTTPGNDPPLYILPSGHRDSFQTKPFGWRGTLSATQTAPEQKAAPPDGWNNPATKTPSEGTGVRAA